MTSIVCRCECVHTFLGLVFLCYCLIIVAQGSFVHFLLLNTELPSKSLGVI